MESDLSPQQHQELVKANILGSFHNTEDILEKGGKKMPIGTTSNGYKKVAEGKWQKVSGYGMTKNEHLQKYHTETEAINKNRIANGGKKVGGKIAMRHFEQAFKLDDKDYSDDEVLGKKEATFSKEDVAKIKIASFDNDTVEFEQMLEEDPEITPDDYILSSFGMYEEDGSKYVKRFYNKVHKKYPEVAERIIKEYGDTFMYN